VEEQVKKEMDDEQEKLQEERRVQGGRGRERKRNSVEGEDARRETVKFNANIMLKMTEKVTRAKWSEGFYSCSIFCNASSLNAKRDQQILRHEVTGKAVVTMSKICYVCLTIR
jgi:hypothetical protein